MKRNPTSENAPRTYRELAFTPIDVSLIPRKKTMERTFII